MSSNYDEDFYDDEVREDPDGVDQGRTKEVRCNACKGSGLVLVGGYETDCIECEGFGSVEVPDVGPGY